MTALIRESAGRANYLSNTIRVIQIDGQPWFVAADVRKVLHLQRGAVHNGVSADGNVVVGRLANNHAFIARATLSTVQTTPGLMDVPNFQLSLANLSGLPPLSLNADQVINGAHSSPLFTLLDAGQSSAWFTGDGGYADMRTSRCGLGAGEIGFGRGLEGGWTVRLSGGGQYSRFDLGNGGNANFSGGYIAPEAALSSTIASWGR